MENAKQKAIRVAYGEYWEQVKDYVDDNGYVRSTDFLLCNTEIEHEDLQSEYGYFFNRPKSLQGIETNNNWISIESEFDLPSENGSYFVYSETNYSPYFRIDLFTGRLANSFENGKSCFTHYQPIVKPLKPHY